MKSIKIGDQSLRIKKYYCDDGLGYLSREDERLWLYVNVTDVCSGRCPFCINPSRYTGRSPFDLSVFCETLMKVKDHVYGVSLTGGEPMLEPELTDEILSVVNQVFGDEIEIDMVTNGIHFDKIKSLKNLNTLTTIHVSRHHFRDEANRQLFGFDVPETNLLKQVISDLKDPGLIVFNCALIKGYVDSVDKIAEYLEFAADLNVSNTSFIGLSVCNDYCKEHYIDPASFDLSTDSRFHIWNTQRDYQYCHCCTCSYDALSRPVRFYYRCIGKERAQYTRQLVYTANNRLLAGFGGKEIHP